MRGCGREQQKNPDEIAKEVEELLSRNGWGDRAKVVVIDPELEVWLWARSPHVADELGWKNGWDSLRTWLRDNEIWDDGAPKPGNPKEAVEKALVGKSTSMVVFDPSKNRSKS